MDTLEIAFLICVGLFLKMALTGVAVYKLRLPSSKRTRKMKRKGGQREGSARELKTESRPILKSSSAGSVHKQAISSGEKSLKSGPDANELQPEAIETWKSAHSEGVGPWSNRKKMPAHNKAGERIERTEVREQGRTKSTAPIKRLTPKGPLKAYSASYHTSITGTPQEQSAIAEPKIVEKPPLEPSAGNTSPAGKKDDSTRIAEPAQIGKESESGADTGPGAEVNQTGSEPPEATADSGETDQEMPQKQKSGLGDLADLFATSASEFTEKNRLAEEVNDVDVNELLKEGLGLLDKVKKSDV